MVPVYGELPNRPDYGGLRGVVTIAQMRDIIILLVHLIVTVIRLAGPEGLRSVVAESALLRHQLLILNRGRKRAPSVGSRARSSLAAIRQASAARMERSRNAESAANS